MKRVDTAKGASEGGGNFLLAPRAQKEVQQGIKDLKKNKIHSAQEHLEKALRMAPGNPDVNYLLGMCYLQARQPAQAEVYLKKALSIDPSEVRASLALAEIRYEQGDDAGVIQVLGQVPSKAPNVWQAHWLLAMAYLGEKKFSEAAEHAQRALEAGKKKARGARLTLGEALAGMGKRAEAAKTLETFLKENPKDLRAKQVSEWITQLRKPPPIPPPAAVRSPAASSSGKNATPEMTAAAESSPPAAVSGPAAAPPAPATELPEDESWMPADVDTVRPAIVSSAACPLSTVMKEAGEGMEEFIGDLQKFSATEEFQFVEVGRHGELKRPFERKFDYMVFVEKPRPHVFVLREMRNRELGVKQMGGPVVDTGTAALALVFHPQYQSNFEWKCEGLGSWKGRPAWVVHFQQRADLPISGLTTFDTPAKAYPLALKGRAWLTQKKARVLHLDVDLMNPVKEVRLEGERFSIDYREVSFASHDVKLWLPEEVNFYVEYRGHAYHEYHRYSHFELFWVGTEQKIGKAKEN
jgi:tetratricopeptide (TPR) repeat protein